MKHVHAFTYQLCTAVTNKYMLNLLAQSVNHKLSETHTHIGIWLLIMPLRVNYTMASGEKQVDAAAPFLS